MKRRKIFVYTACVVIVLAVVSFVVCSTLGACGSDKYAVTFDEDPRLMRISFDADSAWAFTEKQCSFGPRTMNSEAHDECGKWIEEKFAEYGLEVDTQRAKLTAWDGTTLSATNIIARLEPSKEQRILICAHWDSRAWADNDENEKNHHTPIMAANDGASGVGVMIELARVVSRDSLSVGVDFVCFDAEDYGVPQWAEDEDYEGDSWALGAQYWAEQYAKSDEKAKYEFGILLDMVGGEGARFYKERMSEKFAPRVLKRVWQAAHSAGYGSVFPMSVGSYVNDDHLPVNEVAGIPCIDIIPYYPDCPQSSFGPTWHTVDDTMDHISKSTLKAVGQTVARLLAEY